MKRTKSAKGTHMRTTAIPALLATMALLLLATGGRKRPVSHRHRRHSA